MLFDPGQIGTLTVPNRLVRSATAERLAATDGAVTPALKALYQDLVRGGVGLIITGQMYVDPSGKAHAGVTGIHSDDLIPGLAEVTRAVHRTGGRIVAQINHAGMHCSRDTVSQTLAPSAVDAPFLSQVAREMTGAEVERMVDAYGQAARRAKEAGFDGVQVHAAHGYLVSEFLSPYANHRTDVWGGDLSGRTRFLRAVAAAVRGQVGPDYPCLIKFGMADEVDRGLTARDGVQVAAGLAGMGFDAVEISVGISDGRGSSRGGILTAGDEAYYRPWARELRKATRLPILLVGGLRSMQVMEDVLAAGDADFISLGRPLICEPDLPARLRLGVQDRAGCIAANRCWPEEAGKTFGCRCPI